MPHAVHGVSCASRLFVGTPNAAHAALKWSMSEVTAAVPNMVRRQWALGNTTLQRHEILQELMPVVGTVTRQDGLQSVVELLGALPGPASGLRNALLYVTTAHESIVSVKQLANAMGCSRATLWKHWRKAAIDASAMRLEDFLDGIVLVRAVTVKRSGVSWGAVARSLSVSEETLSRTLRRLAGTRRCHLTSEPASAVIARFEDRIRATFAIRSTVNEGRYVARSLMRLCGRSNFAILAPRPTPLESRQVHRESQVEDVT